MVYFLGRDVAVYMFVQNPKATENAIGGNQEVCNGAATVGCNLDAQAMDLVFGRLECSISRDEYCKSQI